MWRIESGKAKPDFLKYLYPDVLKAIRPAIVILPVAVFMPVSIVVQ